LDVSFNYPGGTTLQYHSSNAVSQALIAEGGWDFVVLQEQSQLPSFPLQDVESDCFPYAALLNEQILEANPCAETMYYMTWGRENGDAGNCDFWPPVCTYEGMDDLLKERYLAMAEMNDGVVAPVGAVRRFIRENFPDIQLYAGDGSHPSMVGSYVAAVCFYTCIFRRDPQLITMDYGIDDSEETIVKQVVHDLVYNAQSDWYITAYDPIASMEIENSSGSTFVFTNTSLNADEFIFYNSTIGTSEPLESPSIEITFPELPEYDVCLTAIKCDLESTVCYHFVNGVLTTKEMNSPSFVIYPNPTSDVLNVDVGNWDDNFQMRIIDGAGKSILNGTFKNRTSLDISGYAQGFYFVEIKFGNQVSRTKLAKN